MTYEQFFIEHILPQAARVATPREEAKEPEGGHDEDRTALEAVQEGMDRRN